MLKAILFDFDGTIVDSLKHHLKAYRKTYQEYGKKLTDEDIMRDVFYTSIKEKTSRYGISDIEKFRETHWKYLWKDVEKIKVQQHLTSVFDFLREKKIKLAVTSGADSTKISMILERIGIRDYFDVVLGRNDVDHQKPHPEIAKKAMAALGVKPEETLFIGDMDFDVLAGKNAKTKTALFLPETNLCFADFDALRKAKPDFEFSNYKELPEKIKHLL
jgi:pyrophosphatase PpaX